MSKRAQSNRAGKLCITIIVLMLVGVMFSQIFRLHRTNEEYKVREAALEAQKIEEEARKEELDEYERYTSSQEYVEDTAKSKLGLVYEDDIVFKEQ